jgi:CRISPR-associated endonuclease/helicase Cas3
MPAPISIAEPCARFREEFEALKGTCPYPWQEKLFNLFIKGEFPPDINLPTGSGKTSIIPIWLIAIARQALQPETLTVPRRLVWVVNRRVVVDQATEEAERIRERLADQDGILALKEVRNGLRKLGHDPGKSELIAISTLRGEREDNREWSNDPSRPAIIVGTVDMAGSRLLFSGYGDSRYWRGQHAGLLGHDALIINDEAHLTPAFAELIRTVESVQSNTVKPFRTIRLSATHAEKKCWPGGLEADRNSPFFKKIYESKKILYSQVHPAAKVESAMVELATQKGSGRTLLFVTEPDKAQKLAASIKKKVGAESAKRVVTLTGTMRGFERDDLVKREEFKAFTVAARPQDDYWLVATSAGEVGINISSDQLITSLDTLDHLLQRFGRLNRFGETQGVAYLISSDKEKNERKLAALDFLHKHLPSANGAYNISPEALFGLDLDSDACAERPLLAPLHSWHIDAWSQTSVGSHPSRPAAAPWLHGKEDNLPETFLAWREDVRIAEGPAGPRIDDEDREEILEKYPLLAHEQLREPTQKLIEKLAVLFSSEDRKASVWRRKPDGATDVLEFPRINSDIDLRKDAHVEAAIRELAYCQLILPPGCGKPEDGMFEPVWLANFDSTQAEGTEPESNISTPYDLSGAQTRTENGSPPTETRASLLAINQDIGGWLLKRLGGVPGKLYSLEHIGELTRFQLNQFAAQHGWRFLLEARLAKNTEGSEAARRLLYFGPASQRTQVPKGILLLSEHSCEVAKKALAIASSLNLPYDLARALETAGKLHDLGKLEEIWQRAAGNWDVDKCACVNEPVAKPIGIMRGRQLSGFRHELASVLRAKGHEGLSQVNYGFRELVFHLIAAHHGHGRPCFEAKAYDRARLRESAELALECTKRFARLQQQYGPWGLAYLESILRAADGLASQIAPEQPING